MRVCCLTFVSLTSFVMILFRALLVAMITCLFAAPTVLGAQNTYVYPKLPARGARLANFVPAGWHILEQTQGQLNRDTLTDIAAVIEADAVIPGLKEPDNDQQPRILLVLFKLASGQYRLAIQSNGAIMLSNEGGAFGDPWAGMEVNRGSLLIRFYGGSSDRWAYTYRWRFQNNDWYLIGATCTTTSTHHNNFETHDFNLLTGQAEYSTGPILDAESAGAGAPVRKRPLRVEKQPLLKLRDIQLGQTRLYGDIYF